MSLFSSFQNSMFTVDSAFPIRCPSSQLANIARSSLLGLSFFSTRSNQDVVLLEFWEKVYDGLEEDCLRREDRKKSPLFYSHACSLLFEYKDKGSPSDPAGLHYLQEKLEDLTRRFSEENIFQETSPLCELLFVAGKPNAKEYLRDLLDKDLFNSTVRILGDQTLEAILVYSLASAFNPATGESMVKLPMFLAGIEHMVETQVAKARAQMSEEPEPESRAETERSRDRRGSGKSSSFAVASGLIDFLRDRGAIEIELVGSGENSTDSQGSWFRQSQLVVICKFDLSRLPWKLNLPMVTKPMDWEHPNPGKDSPLMLSEFVGGYLTSNPVIPGGLVSSRNLSNFDIEVSGLGLEKLIPLLNDLQCEGFKINKEVLTVLHNERDLLEEKGLLARGVLATVNVSAAICILKNAFLTTESVSSLFDLDTLLNDFALEVQRARHEAFLISLATAYLGYVFYLPVFVDFRGRMYRAGSLTFHGRDLAKSLLLFADSGESLAPKLSQAIVWTSASYKYRKFHDDSSASEWFNQHLKAIYSCWDGLIRFASAATDPFQFMSKILCPASAWNQLPISQDASSSAYQILAYFTLNEGLARSTNLLPGQMQDLYDGLLQHLQRYLSFKLDAPKFEVVDAKLSRSLVKRLFLPMVYGKTVIAIKEDLRSAFGHSLSEPDLLTLSRLCLSFWSAKYPESTNFMQLIQAVSRLCVELNREVRYSTPLFTTHQDYRSFGKERVSVYHPFSRQRRRVTLSVPAAGRDKRKTTAATVANFLHQKDAEIAMTVLRELKALGAPVYCVHDNFVTSPAFVHLVPGLYCKAFVELGSPLAIMNDFIRDNLRCHMKNEDMNVESLKSFLDGLAVKGKGRDWKASTQQFLKAYGQYLASVGGHAERWAKFKTQLLDRKTNYSVHY